MLIFGMGESLDFLSNADDWFADGTFDVVPAQFTQLYTVHGLKNGRNIVGCYGLLSNKTRQTYVDFFTQVQALTGGAVPHSIMTDFEIGAINAFSDVYPNVNQFGCHFHLFQSIQRHVREQGLTTLYE